LWSTNDGVATLVKHIDFGRLTCFYAEIICKIEFGNYVASRIRQWRWTRGDLPGADIGI
jgi:hypothetical protein